MGQGRIIVGDHDRGPPAFRHIKPGLNREGRDGNDTRQQFHLTRAIEPAFHRPAASEKLLLVGDHWDLVPGNRRFNLTAHNRKELFGGEIARVIGIVGLGAMGNQAVEVVDHPFGHIAVVIKGRHNRDFWPKHPPRRRQKRPLHIGIILRRGGAMQTEEEAI